jgi:TamB, inner membrane protein subunit of TAM complex
MGTSPIEGPGSPELVEPAPISPRERRRIFRRLLRWTGGALAVLAFAVLGVAQTGIGQRVLLDGVLSRVRGSLAGELTIQGIRSGTLFAGATLIGVNLDAEGGRRFLHADSVSLRYSLIGFFTGTPRVGSTTVFGLDLEVSRYVNEERANVQRLMRPRSDSVGAGRDRQGPMIDLGLVHVRGGTVDILAPSTGASGGFLVDDPGGEGRLRRIGFTDVDLDLEDAVLRLGDPDRLFAARLASLSTSVWLRGEPFEIEEAFGSISYGSGGLDFEESAFRFPGTLLRGSVAVGPRTAGAPWAFVASLTADGEGSLSDLHWLDPRIPAGAFRGGAEIVVDRGVDVALRGFAVDLEASHLTADGHVRFSDVLSFEHLDLTANPLPLERLGPWMGRDAPFDGWLSGEARVSGTLADIESKGRLTLVPKGFGGAPTTVDFEGTLHGGENPGATDLVATFDPVNYELLSAFLPGARVRGMGQGRLEVSGRVEEGLRFTLDASREEDSPEASRVVSRGALRRADGGWIVDVQADLAPFALSALDDLAPTARLRGAVTGPVRAVGRLRDLNVTAKLDAAGGRLDLEGAVDLRDPGSWYRLDVSMDSVPLSEYSGVIPERSRWSGRTSFEGRGVGLDSLAATATLAWARSRLGYLSVDTVTASLTAADGALRVDTLDAMVGGVRVTGGGRLGISEGTEGVMRLAFSTDQLGGLRPLLLGDTVIAKDTLRAIESEFLRLAGIDPDTLPNSADVAMLGRMTGVLTLHGSIGALDGKLEAILASARYGRSEVDSATVSMSVGGLPSLSGDWDVALDAHGLVWQDRALESARLDATMSRSTGVGSVEVERKPGERYALRGSFMIDSIGGRVDLEEGSATLDSLSWSLARPTRVEWDRVELDVDDLEITREGDDPMRLKAGGSLSRVADSDFRVSVQGLHLDRWTRVAELADLGLSGHADLTLSVTGSADDPAIDGTVSVVEPRFEGMALSRIAGSLRYRGRNAELRVDAWDGDHAVFGTVGTIPYDLSLTRLERRSVRRDLDLRMTADSLDAAVALAYFRTLKDVEGKVSGTVVIRGRTDAPEPDGEVLLDHAAWSIEALGVRHREVSGRLKLSPHGTVDVALSTAGSGRSEVAGTVTLDPLSNPLLDLDVSFQGFQAVNRRDLEGRISGEFNLGGRYDAPLIRGSLTVDRGTLFVDEFVRSVDVVDLRDPRLFDTQVVDTTVFSAQPLLRDLRNPFLDRLRVEVDLAVPRDSWLRSNDMNVEMGGDLIVTYDRANADLVLLGELEALRGTYTVLGRAFTVSGGTVGFIGIPGINPTLAVEATTRIRRVSGDPLDIDATVAGTLTHPEVTFSSDEVGLAQSDLLSYLWFGRSSAELATGQRAFVSGAAGGLAGAALESGITMLSGAFTSRYGAALAQGIGVDYLTITQAGDFAFLSGNVAGALAGTQFEVGQYLGEDVFIVVILRPLTDQRTGASFLGGARLEWTLTNDYTVEGFVEDRFLRSGTAGFGDLGLQSRIVGVFVFREWGY